MIRFRTIGGESVSKGTYWNFNTGKKVTMENPGILPGKSSESFYKLPPMLILAAAAAAAHLFLYVLPGQLVQFYEQHTEMLITAYVVLDYLIIGVLLLALIAAAARDVLNLRSRVPSFDWHPAESHLSGKRQDKSGKEQQNRHKTDADGPSSGNSGK